MMWLILLIIQVSWSYSTILIPVDKISQDILDTEIRVSEVKCNKSGMSVTINFQQPFNGVIYSMGYYDNPKCRYIQGEKSKQVYNFNIPLDACGTKPLCKSCSAKKNIIIIQTEDSVEEIRDSARIITCKSEDNGGKKLGAIQHFNNNNKNSNFLTKNPKYTEYKNEISKEKCDPNCNLQKKIKSKFSSIEITDVFQTTHDIEAAEQISDKASSRIIGVAKTVTKRPVPEYLPPLKFTTTVRPSCYPDSSDPRCPTTNRPNYAPNTEPLQQPVPIDNSFRIGYNQEPPPSCYPGSRDPKCPQPFKPIITTSPIPYLPPKLT